MTILGGPGVLGRAPDRRRSQTRSGEDRRKVMIPPPGSQLRSGQDRRLSDRRSGVDCRASQAGSSYSLIDEIVSLLS